MPRRGSIRKRERMFAGAEGQSERSLTTWFQRICNNEGLHLHLDAQVCGGGDSRAVVEFAERRYRLRTERFGRYSDGLVLLDKDRLEQDRRSGRSPVSGGRLKRIWLRPNLEGLLLRLHPGHESRFLAAERAEEELKKLWLDYKKPCPADSLEQRFDLVDLRRAAHHDADLALLLELLGLA